MPSQTGLDHSIEIIERLTRLAGQLACWASLAIVVLTFAVVVLRYGFNLGWIAMQESVLYLHGLIFMLGAAYTLCADGHVRVDIFYQRCAVKTQAWINLLGVVLLLAPTFGFIFYICFDYVASSWAIKEQSAQTGGLAYVYLAKSLLLLLAITMLMQGFAEALKHIRTLTATKADKV